MMMLPASKRVPAAVSTSKRPDGCRRDRGDFLAEVEPGMERLDLLEQPVDEFLRAAHRQRRDVVDRLVGIELGALAAGVCERIDDLALHAEQAELEYGEEPDRAGADDHAFGLDGGSRRGFVHGRFPVKVVPPTRGEGRHSNR